MTATEAKTIEGTAIAVRGPSEVIPVQSETAAVLSMIERAARDPAVDIDKLERLMAMHKEAQAQRRRDAYNQALAEMQPKLPVIDAKGRIEVREKDAQGRRTGEVQQSTPYAKWEDINDAIKPILGEHGFALTFNIAMKDASAAGVGAISITTILKHNAGHQEETTFVLPHDSTGSKNAVQAIGSSTAYGKRYGACAMLNITSRMPVDRDDDGQKGGGPQLIDEQQVAELSRLLSARPPIKLDAFLLAFKIEKLSEMPLEKYSMAVSRIGEARKAAEAKRKAK